MIFFTYIVLTSHMADRSAVRSLGIDYFAEDITIDPIIDGTPGFEDNNKEADSSKRIIGGRGRSKAENPAQWNVVLLKRNKVFCGGALLSPYYILTAAHCKPSFRFNGSDVALVGAKDKSLALYQAMKHKGSFDEFIVGAPNILETWCSSNFLRLPKRGLKENEVKGKILTAVGWVSVTRVSHQQLLDNIRKGTKHYLMNGEASVAQKQIMHVLEKMTNQVVSSQIKSTLRKKSGLSMLCTSTCTHKDLSSCQEKSRGTCAGDSGSESVYEKEGTTPDCKHQSTQKGSCYKTQTLIGIASWAAAYGYSEYPEIYGRVSSVLNWIQEKTGTNDSLYVPAKQ